MKHITKWMLLTVVALLTGFGAGAQTVEEVIGKHLDALGGKEKLNSLSSLYEETATQLMGQDVPVKIWIQNREGMRTEMAIMGQTIVVAVNKDKGWMINPIAGSAEPQPLPVEQVKQSVSQMNLAGEFLHYQQNGAIPTLLGKEKVDANDCYKVELKKADSSQSTYYIDAATYYINKVVVKLKVNGSLVEQGVVYSDYKKTPEGYVFPYSTSVSTQMGEIVSKVSKLEVNKPIDAKLFESK